MMKGLSDNPSLVDPEKERQEAEARERMEEWAQKMRGFVDTERGESVELSDSILQMIFKDGPYIRVVYGEEGHEPDKPFSFYYFEGSKDEFFPSHNESKRVYKTAEQIESYLSQPIEAIKSGKWPSQPQDWVHGPGAMEE